MMYRNSWPILALSILPLFRGGIQAVLLNCADFGAVLNIMLDCTIILGDVCKVGK